MNGKNGFKMKNYFFYSQKFILISCKSPQKLVNKPKKQSFQSQKNAFSGEFCTFTGRV